MGLSVLRDTRDRVESREKEVAAPLLGTECPLSATPEVTALIIGTVTACGSCGSLTGLCDLCTRGCRAHVWHPVNIGRLGVQMEARAFAPSPQVRYQNSPSSLFLSSRIFSLGLSSSHVLELKREKGCFCGNEGWGGCGGDPQKCHYFSPPHAALQTTESHIPSSKNNT